MNTSSALLLALAAFVSLGIASAEAAHTHLAHEGPSVSIPASKITFAPTGLKADGLELKVGQAYGDVAHGKHGTFVLMPAGFVSAVHTHTDDYYATVVKGIATNGPAGAPDLPLPVGSYWFQRGEEPHVTKCLSKTDCLFFMSQQGKYDYLASKP
jgi:beta-alanine degradation protein BauB